MILKSCIVAVAFCLGWLETVSGSSYSKVYLQRGSSIIPVEYVNYGAPPAQLTDARISQLSAPPVGSVLPYQQLQNFAPCVAPCIIQGPSFGPAGNARLVTYRTPNVPVAVAPPKDEPSSYEYSYVVYDENTGDQKAQRELSDGVVVRGQYSLIQPDGYIREVQYTADDIKGFNAIVKNFLPEDADKKIVEGKEKKDSSPPCIEVKNEALVEELKPEEEPKTEEGHNVDEVLEVAKIEETKEGEEVKKPRPPGHSAETSDEHAEHEVSGLEKDEEPSHEVAPEPVDADMRRSIYNDFIKCIQTASQAYRPGQDGPSPLTLILLPKKC